MIASLLSALIVVTTAACGSSGDDPPPPAPTSSSPPVWTPEPTDEPLDVFPNAYGDDAHLDTLWDACTVGDAASCEALYYDSPIGSQYEAWGATCGGLTTGGGCQQEAPPVEQPAAELSEYARVATWYSDAEADHSAWVHFKAVDVGGYTVAEALGSDLLDMQGEAEAMDRTAERVALVDEVRRQMAEAGWTELGVDGDWYEYVFGR